MMLDRAGGHTGALEYQLRNSAPDAASASMFGVFRSAAPRQPRSRQPKSSATKTMKFGGVDAAAGSNAGAAAVAINSRLEIGIVSIIYSKAQTAWLPARFRIRRSGWL